MWAADNGSSGSIPNNIQRAYYLENSYKYKPLSGYIVILVRRDVKYMKKRPFQQKKHKKQGGPWAISLTRETNFD